MIFYSNCTASRNKSSFGEASVSVTYWVRFFGGGIANPTCWLHILILPTISKRGKKKSLFLL